MTNLETKGINDECPNDEVTGTGPPTPGQALRRPGSFLRIIRGGAELAPAWRI